MSGRSPAIYVGLIGGLLFFAHAMLENSHAWPMLWPVVAGAAAVALAGSRHRLHGFWSGVGLAARTGLVAGAVFFVATAAALALLASGSFGRVAEALGAKGPIVVSASMLVVLAAVAAAGVVLAALGGAAALPLARRAR